MSMFSHVGTDDVSQVTSSVTSKTEINYEYHQQESAFQQSLTSRELIDESGMGQDCLFFKGVLDDCYQSRLYARVLEFYFIENHPKHGPYRCPMENCKIDEFDDLKQMILHLKGCKYFKQGYIRCPGCNNVERFRKTSNKGCSWNRPSLKHRIQKKLEAALDIIKRIASCQAESTMVLGLCQNCGHPITPNGLDKTPQLLHSHSPTGSISNTSSTTDHCQDDLGKHCCYEVLGKELYDITCMRPCEAPNTYLPCEAPNDYLLYEAPGDNSLCEALGLRHREDLSKQHLELIDSQGHTPELPTYDKIQLHVPHDTFTSGQPSVYNLPSELGSSPVNPGAISSTGVSPLFAATLTTTSTENSQCQSSLTSHQYSGSSSDHEIISNKGHNMDEMRNNWQGSRLTRLYDPASTRDLVDLESSFGQPLSIQTGYDEPDVNYLLWDNSTFYQGPLGPVNSTGHLRDIPSVPMMETSLSDAGAFAGPSVQIADGNIATNIGPISPSSPLGSTIPSSNSDQPPESELSENELTCSSCGFRPSGKEANRRAYLRKHETIHQKPTFPCDHCGKPYTRRDNMVVHRDKSHPSPSDRKKRRDNSVDIGMGNQRKKRFSVS
ncbi:uncharacterized protein GGS22DRAFT_187205 [Annulohypoxylon maeteangense]|uniref:uncharacterized protein n=1 Tax=Annulohypoxylon maeteangense TaxID=1927788 RepID=UPI0020081FC2|nr:uncharacterized protein GGS22DRAFT_187205 [Annulohypoxylon maeteangense]KAI0885974.1 hypothetical protein GGS22DRAFT_187205 [Annulohypoxylon maeteangense]